MIIRLNKFFLFFDTFFEQYYLKLLKRLSIAVKRKIELAILILCALVSIVFWDSVILFPIKLFVVLFHEISHGIFAVVTGGEIISIQINNYLGGICTSKGGVEIVIASAGYLGSLIIGALLFYSAYNKKLSLWLNSILAIILLVFAVNFIEGSFGVIFALLSASFLFISPRFFNPVVHSYSMKFLGLISCLYVLIDIKDDLISLEYRITDAQTLSDATGIPALVWGLIWLIISGVAIYFLFRYAYRKGAVIK